MLEYIFIGSGVGATVLAVFAICDLRKQRKNMESKTVYYCRQCEQVNNSEDCPICLKEGARMPWGKAYDFIADVNADRMAEWTASMRVMPECD